jgi:hypothetical protein
MRVLLLVAVTASCAATSPPLASRHVSPRPKTQARAAQASSPRDTIVQQARRYLEGAPLVANGYTFDPDPVGFARAACWAAGIELFDETVAADPEADGMQILFRSAAERGRVHRETPRPGDLVFFDADETGTALYPAGVALVESVATDGTITAIGRFAGGPERVSMNLRSDNAGMARLYRAFATPN